MEGHGHHHPHHHPHHLSHQQHHLQPHQHQHQHQHQQHITVNAEPADRFPQWTAQETKEFLIIRSELDQTFMETKRNKLLWEVIATKMKEKGFNRSAEQCKCKWKNLVTRYKGCETMEAEALRQQFPFYNELQTIFAGRMQRMLWAEAEGGGSGSKKKAVHLSSDEEDQENIYEESEGDQKGTAGVNTRKKKKGKGSSSSTSCVGVGGSGNLREILEEFMKQQIQMELQWREAFEAREKERKMREMEWRQTMEALEKERIMMDRRWREREEQRRIREEARAEKRDALITALLHKLTRSEDSSM